MSEGEKSLRAVPDEEHYYPALLLVPGFEEDVIEADSIRVSRRLWQTSTFDLATLAAEHDLKLPYQLMDVFLGSCNIEIGVLRCKSREVAQERLFAFRTVLYAEGVSPFILPFSTNVSINSYSGINTRDSEFRRNDLPDGMRQGITSQSTLVRAHPLELSLAINTFSQGLKIGHAQVVRALSQTSNWLELTSRDPRLRSFQATLISSASIMPVDQAILHLWTGIEALFPDVKAEVSFRIALYIACIEPDKSKRREIYESAKKAYNVRSAIAHGSSKRIAPEEWLKAWQMATSILRAILIRKGLPSEAELLKEILG